MSKAPNINNTSPTKLIPFPRTSMSEFENSSVEEVIPQYSNLQSYGEILIGQRTTQKKPTWYLIKIGTDWVRTSLNTTDNTEAIHEAFRRHQKYVETGQKAYLKTRPETEVGFDVLALKWLKEQDKDCINKNRNVINYLIPFFKEKVAKHGWKGFLETIAGDSEKRSRWIHKYQSWRTDYWATEVGQKRIKEEGLPKNLDDDLGGGTLNREAPSLNGILRYAESEGLFGPNVSAPKVPRLPDDPKTRPAFSRKQWSKLMDEAEKWIDESETPIDRQKRQAFHDYIVSVRGIGVRPPHEASLLCWKHIDFDNGYLKIPGGKTGPRKVAILYPSVLQHLKGMMERRKKWCDNNKQEFTIEEQIFLIEDGTEIKGLGDLCSDLVNRCGFVPDSDELPHTLYSLRHTFATLGLLDGFPKDILIETMGTSQRMFDAHYKHLTAVIVKEHFGLNQTHQVINGEETELVIHMDGDLPEDHPLNRRLVLAPDSQ